MGQAALHCCDCSQLGEEGDVSSPEAEHAVAGMLGTSLRDLMFLVIRCPSKAPSDPGAHSQRLTQPSPLISSFLQESGPWKDAALQEDIPGGFNHCTRSSPAALVVQAPAVSFN